MTWGLDNKRNEIRELEPEQKKPNTLNHEIRSVLHALLGYLDIFQDETKQNLNTDQVELLNRILVFANRLTNLIDEILAVESKQYKKNLRS